MSNVDVISQTAGDSIDPFQAALFRGIAGRLSEMGLSSLFSFDASGNPHGWLWDVIVNGDFTTQEEVQTLLEQRPEFQARFPALFALREMAGQGKPVQVLTPAQIVDYEAAAKDLMRRYNMPPELYNDAVADIQPLIAKGISMTGLDQRIRVAWNRVANVDPYIRGAMRDYYGTQDDEHMAAFFLDPDKFEAKLEQFSRAAGIGGTAMRQGFRVGQGLAEDLAGLGFDEQNTREAFGRLSQSKLYDETISEGQMDLHKEIEGVTTELGTDALSASLVEGRKRTRAAAFQGGGGAIRTDTGYGVGEAQ